MIGQVSQCTGCRPTGTEGGPCWGRRGILGVASVPWGVIEIGEEDWFGASGLAGTDCESGD